MRMILVTGWVFAACGPGTVLISGTLRDTISGDPIEGATICAVHPAEEGCATTDAAGLGELEVSANLDALDIRVEADGYFPANTYGYTTDEDRTDVVLQLIHKDSAGLLKIATGVELDDSKGVVSVFSKNADGSGASGITVDLEPASGELFYMSGSGFPVPDATATDGNGLALLVNADPGEATVSVPSACTPTFAYADFAGSQDIVIEASALTFVQVECEDQ